GKISLAVFLSPILTFFLFLIAFIKAIQVLRDQTPTSGIIGSLIMFFSVGFLLSTILLIIGAFVRLKTSEFAITNKRIIAKTGFIRRNAKEILLSRVESIGVDQNVLGRVMSFGTIKITGTGGTQQIVKALTNPLVIRKRINQVVENFNPEIQELIHRE
ncbi:MAG: PH domain-containing protein, partial [Ignavibacteria bacterium]|nr:PH domain-containing protein [Ignavibacteria bacterium]